MTDERLKHYDDFFRPALNIVMDWDNWCALRVRLERAEELLETTRRVMPGAMKKVLQWHDETAKAGMWFNRRQLLHWFFRGGLKVLTRTDGTWCEIESKDA
jgi:hypothetical protein